MKYTIFTITPFSRAEANYIDPCSDRAAMKTLRLLMNNNQPEGQGWILQQVQLLYLFFTLFHQYYITLCIRLID